MWLVTGMKTLCKMATFGVLIYFLIPWGCGRFRMFFCSKEDGLLFFRIYEYIPYVLGAYLGILLVTLVAIIFGPIPPPDNKISLGKSEKFDTPVDWSDY